MKYLVGVALGFIIGLPQGFGPVTNLYEVDSLPRSTVYIIIALGSVGGLLGGFTLLDHNPDVLSKYVGKFIDLYSFMTVCMLSMGIPVLVKVGFDDFYASTLSMGYLFSAAGMGLVLAGIGKLLWKHRTQST